MSKVYRMARTEMQSRTRNAVKSPYRYKRKRGYFDFWSRNESNSFRSELVSALGVRNEAQAHNPDNRYGAFELFSLLPTPSYSGCAFADLDLGLIQARALFSKDDDLVSPIDREAEAWKSFEEAERTCGLVNQNFRDNCFPKRDADAILNIAQRKIALILGDCPALEDLEVSFGPGAAATCRRKTTARWKLSTPPSISSSMLGYRVNGLSALAPSWFALHGNEVRIVPGELEFVPKNYKTHRSIVIEPSLTGALQRSVGSVLKRKLYRAGIDLTNQEINRKRARQGSIDGSLATIDLSRASDSIAYLLVMELLPHPWFSLLDMLRTPVVRYKNRLIELEKFSSMGNGYTFELESLLFYALAYAISVHNNLKFDCTVYGDDIIVNTDLAEHLVEWLPVFGFTPNTEKSYLSGPFRESCGFDSFLGVDVRPFYLKGRFTSHRVVCFYNFLMRKPWFDPGRKVRNLLLSKIPAHHFLWGPDGYGDGHLISGDPSSVLKPYKREMGWAGFIFETFVAVPYKDRSECIGDEIISSYQASYGGIGWTDSHYVLRFPKAATMRSQKRRVYVLGGDS